MGGRDDGFYASQNLPRQLLNSFGSIFCKTPIPEGTGQGHVGPLKLERWSHSLKWWQKQLCPWACGGSYSDTIQYLTMIFLEIHTHLTHIKKIEWVHLELEENGNVSRR